MKSKLVPEDIADHACPYCRPKEFPGLTVPQHQGTLNHVLCSHGRSHGHIYIDSEHEDGLDAEYCKKHGILTLVCHSCGGLVEMFAIAETLTLVPSKTGPYLLEPKGIWDAAAKVQ